MAKRVTACLVAVFLMFSCADLQVFAVEANLSSEDARKDRGGRMQPLVLDLPEGASNLQEFFPSTFSKKGSQSYHSDWDRYSTNFYYNQLTDEEKG